MPELEMQPTVRVRFWTDTTDDTEIATLTKGSRLVNIECLHSSEDGVEFAMRLAHLLEQMPEALFPDAV